MLTYLKIALRRITKQKTGTLINLSGLVLAFTVFLILMNFVYQQSTYDHFHQKADRIYQLISRFTNNNGNDQTYSICLGTIVDDYKADFPQVEVATMTYGPHKTEVDRPESRFSDVKVLYADYDYFRVFDFPIRSQESFTNPDQAIISQELSQRFFGGELAVGESLTVEGLDYQIAEVIDVPHNTQFKWDLVLPIHSFPDIDLWKKGGLEFEVFVALQEEANTDRNKDLLLDRYNSAMLAKFPIYKPANFFLPLKMVYLNDVNVATRFGNDDPQLIRVLTAIAFVILLIGVINYINLQAAGNHARMLQTRIKKVMGAHRSTILKEGLIESFVILTGAGLSALFLVGYFYKQNVDELIGNNPFTLEQWPFELWMYVGMGLLLLVIAAGAIPSLGLFKRTKVNLAEANSKKLGKGTIALVVFQFLVSAFLLNSIFIIRGQMSLLRNQSPGFEADQVLVIDNLSDAQKEKYSLIKEQLLDLPEIYSVAGSQSSPGRGASGQLVRRAGWSSEDSKGIAHIRTTGDYAETLGLTFLSGQDFTQQSELGQPEFIINQAARKLLFEPDENPIGETLHMSGRVGRVVGVVNDFHYRSFHHEISPLLLNVEEPYQLTLMAKISTGNLERTLERLDMILRSTDPKYVFDYHFLNEQFDQTYQSELRTQTILTYATVIAILIAIMGLLALSMFVIHSKTKEVAIRKTLGASGQHILWQLTNNILIWISLGNILAIPLVMLFGRSWVSNFQYQFDLTHLWWIVPICTLMVLFVAFSTIVQRLIQTLRLNPVHFLRHE